MKSMPIIYDNFHFLVHAGPGQKTETKSWEAIFARPQPDMENNPKKATYGADWQKTLKAYPWLKKTARSVIKDLEKRKFKMTNKFSFKMPFTRVCVPVRRVY